MGSAAVFASVAVFDSANPPAAASSGVSVLACTSALAHSPYSGAKGDWGTNGYAFILILTLFYHILILQNNQVLITTKN